MSLITISYTPLDAGGGVPKFNRQLGLAFHKGVHKHYSWWDVAQAFGHDPNNQSLPEWEKARVLNAWLLKTGKITERDVVVADSFWADGLEKIPNVISHQHGNWSHTTLDDVLKGVPPEFPMHAKIQENFRSRWLSSGHEMTAVSNFIADQMRLQWGFPSTVINNGIDILMYGPREKLPRERPLIIHGTTNSNKGFDHIEAIKKLDADVMLLDDAAKKFGLPNHWALAQADVVVHPSAHEGNSYFVLEALACDVPVVTYNVGLMYWFYKNRVNVIRDNLPIPGVVDDRNDRSPEITFRDTEALLRSIARNEKYEPRRFASMFSLVRFNQEWHAFLTRKFPNGDLS